jgi:TRAP-type C4-dicarboxylate transport system permease large subunit
VKIGQVLKPMMGFYVVLVALLLLVTYVPALSLFLPRLLLGY